MRVLCLDVDLGVGADHYAFGSSVSLYDYDVVFWAPATSLTKYLTYADTYRGKASVREDESARLMNDVKRRRAEFKDFVEMGRCLVVITPGDTEVYVDTGEREYSGTGRNRATTRIVKPFDLMTAVPVTIGRSHGSGVEMVPANSTMAALFKRTADCWAYRCVIDDREGLRPLLHIKGTQKTVAGLLKIKGAGLIALLPDLVLPFADEEEEIDDEGDPESGESAVKEGEVADRESDDDAPWPGNLILNWVEFLVAEPDSSLPGWTADYRFPSEVDRQQKQLVLEREVAELQQQIDSLNAERAQDERWKTLVTGTGVPLERRVREGLEVLGFVLEEGDVGRTDLRGDLEGRRVVVEVKGVSKSAAERNAAQLEKWVSEELAEGRSAKGILIVNTWRELPLRIRAEDDFPNQMLAYSKQREHCLLTGFQLLALVRAALEEPARCDELAELLMTTDGVLEGWGDIEAVFAPGDEAAPSEAPKDEPADEVETEDTVVYEVADADLDTGHSKEA